MLWIALDFPSLPPGTLEPLAAWTCQFTPRVSLEPPQALVAEVQGSLRHRGGPRALLQAVRDGVAALGFEARLGCAATAQAALWIARGGGGRLEALPVEVAGSEAPFLRSLGIATIGELLALPREGVAKRCGQALVDALDRACGRAPEPRRFYEPPPRFHSRLALPAPAAEAEALLFAARRLLVQLEGLLAARHAGVRGFEVVLHHGKRAASTVAVRLASPSREAARMASLLRERLAGEPLRAPVEELAIEAADFVPLGGGSAGLFGDAVAEEEDWARLLERLRARLGPGAAHGITAVPDHRPEHAWRSVEPGEWDPREFRPGGPRPAWLLASPRRLADGEFALLAGPERIECGWWDGDDARRDYFVARLGRTLGWIYRERESGGWYLHGLFA